MKRVLLLLVAAALIVPAMYSCQSESDDTFIPGDEDTNVSFLLTMPADIRGHQVEDVSGTEPQTRAMTAAQETAVSTIDLYVFREIGGVYRSALAAPIQCEGSYNSALKQFTAKFNEQSVNQRLVIVINARKGGNYGYTHNQPLTTFLGALTFNQVGEWDSSTPVALPMYGITDGQIIANNATLTCNMIRMHAKIDVSLDGSILPAKFVLKDVRLYNRRTSGYIGYDETKWNAGTKEVTDAHVPGTYPGNTVETPTAAGIFNVATSGPNMGKIINELYAFESDSHASDLLKKSAIVIGGYYNGSATLSYYRVDIPDGTTPAATPAVTGGKLLRNHHYDVIVQDVTGPGYTDPGDAFKGSTQLTAIVKPYNLADHSIIIDKQFYLKTDRTQVIFPENGGEATFILETNYNITSQGLPAGIWIDPDEIEYTPAVAPGDEWVKITDIVGADGSLNRTIKMEIFSVAPINRTAKVKVKAGNLNYIINVTYTTNSPFHYINLINNGHYLMDGQVKRADVVSTYPWEAELRAHTHPMGTIATLHTTSGPAAASPGVPFYFTPIDDISGGNPQYVIESLYITFIDKRKILADINCCPSLYSGEATMRANSVIINNPGAKKPVLIHPYHIINAMGNTPGVKTNGELGSDWITNWRTLKAQVLWSDVNDFGTVNSVVKSVRWGGCYWENNHNGNDGLLGMRHLQIVPGNAQGNSLVVLYEDNNGTNGYQAGTTDRIVWSFHVWNVDYWPYDNTVNIDEVYTYSYPQGNTADPLLGTGWLDRNLGALTSTIDQVSTMGFWYEWGRMMPFPGPGSTTANNAFQTIYFAPGTGASLQTIAGQSTGSATNIDYSIENPHKYIGQYNSTGFWLSPAAIAAGAPLWGDGSANYINGTTNRSAYDPCPEGWKIPIYGPQGFGGSWLSSIGSSGYTRGQYNAALGGYYPMTGYATSLTTSEFIGMDAAYRAAASGFAIRQFDSPSGDAFRDYMLGSVRCVKNGAGH